MKQVRIIPRLDVKGPNVVKGIHLEGLRVVGDPSTFAQKYYQGGADEILYIDVVASLYQRNNLAEVVSKAAQRIFIPLTVAGGIRTLEDIDRLLRAGADKVAINTAAVQNPQILVEAAHKFGSQCIVASIEAKRISENHWECFTNNGREKTGVDVGEWCQEVIRLGAGEILLTSVDREGTEKGFDTDLLKAVAPRVSVPLIASGGAGCLRDFVSATDSSVIDAFAVASLFHYDKVSIAELKKELFASQINVRMVFDAK
jgi:cyclase